MRLKKIMALLLCVIMSLSLPISTYAVTKEERINSSSDNVVIISADDVQDDEKADGNVAKSDNTLEKSGGISMDNGVDTSIIEYQDIEINNEDDFIEFAKNCRLDVWSVDKKINLNTDLDMSGRDDFIGVPTFGGYFDGRGHVIEGILIKNYDSYSGLFNYCQKSATILNLNVKGIVFPNGKPLAIGGIVGDNYGLINGCTFNGTVVGDTYTGGIAGFNENSGVIIGCDVDGLIRGEYYTGGIAGENVGGIAACVNNASINIVNKDKNKGLDDFNLDKYKEGFLSWLNDSDTAAGKTEGSSAIGGPVDTGGIAGLSMGSITSCVNTGNVGYEHVGYNVGGIAGRSSGYIYDSKNIAHIYGRKDVGGIVGQAEPYISLNLTEDIVYQLTTNVNKLHDLIDTTLTDADGSSDVISLRLNLMQNFANKALTDTNYLADSGIAWVDGTMSAANEALSRIDYVVDEAAKNGGVFDQTRYAATSTKYAMSNFSKAVKDLDIYAYMSPEERERFDNAKNGLEKATEEYEGYSGDALNGYWFYYVDQLRNDSSKDYYGDEQDLYPMISYPDPVNWPSELIKSFKDYIGLTDLGHFDSGALIEEFEDENGPRYESDIAIDNDAKAKMEENSVDVQKNSKEYADSKYMANHGGTTYAEDVAGFADTMASIILAHTEEMSESTRTDATSAVNGLKSAAASLETAGSEIKRIATNLSERPDIVMPKLGEEFTSRANSLNANLQGVSDNLGYLNNELNAATDIMVSDLQDVNDQFNVIMLLFTDAIDGALDQDYTTIMEDESVNVAMESVDGTVADCSNEGLVNGDIDAGGILGTMAIEYDFDLESDVTGFKDANVNATYQTKCVSRNNLNKGDVTSRKSYAGGITGLQELGTILNNCNYSKIYSESGDYVGGIAGQSLARIDNCSARCLLKGGSYVGGIVGLGNDIYYCNAMPNILSANRYYGAIAGFIDEEGRLKNNYFCSEDLAGIDRISYAGKAEPIGHLACMSLDNVPNEFSKVRVSFLIDGEEASSILLDYSSPLSHDMYPSCELNEDEYLKWDIDEVSSVVSDIEISAETNRFMLTIASKQLRSNGQSVILADGNFTEDDALEVLEQDINLVPHENIVESFRVNIPEDGQTSHQIRYIAPDASSKNIVVYTRIGDNWIETATSMMGKYITFDSVGNVVYFAVSDTPTFMDTYGYYVHIGCGVIAVIILIVILIIVINAAKKRAKNNKNRFLIEENKDNNQEKDEQNSGNPLEEQDDDIEFVDLKH